MSSPPHAIDSWFNSFVEFTNQKPLFRKRFLDALTGVEIELENAGDFISSRYWKITNDGSLRGGGRELVSSFGMRVYQLPDALRSLSECGDLSKTKVSHRTSVHVHHNVFYSCKSDVVATIGLYLLFEPTLYSIAGYHRVNSPFCRPLTWTNFPTLSDGNTFVPPVSRYGGLNVLSIDKYCTLEFRQLEGTIDIHRIFHWVMVTGMLVDYVNRVGPLKIRKKVGEIMTAVDKQDILRSLGSSVFGPYYDETKEINMETIADAYLFLEGR
jgi:hypothetical protein